VQPYEGVVQLIFCASTLPSVTYVGPDRAASTCQFTVGGKKPFHTRPVRAETSSAQAFRPPSNDLSGATDCGGLLKRKSAYLFNFAVCQRDLLSLQYCKHAFNGNLLLCEELG
jgi:hypothetical protein